METEAGVKGWGPVHVTPKPARLPEAWEGFSPYRCHHCPALTGGVGHAHLSHGTRR